MTTWKELVEIGERHWDLCCKLDQQTPYKTPEKAAMVREWWAIANSTIWMYVRTKAQTGEDLSPFPAEILGRIANITEDLSNGIVPTAVSDVAAAGKARPYYRAEKWSIAYGLLYIEAAERGEINDGRAKSTVRETYGVSAQTVRNWIKRRDELVIGIPENHKAPSMLIEKMKSHGSNYALNGRSTMKSPVDCDRGKPIPPDSLV